MTDCLHGEKLEWLEQTQLVFDAITRCYDIKAMSKGVVETIADSLADADIIHDIGPQYTAFTYGFRGDLNWGSAITLPHSCSITPTGILTFYSLSMVHGDISQLLEHQKL